MHDDDKNKVWLIVVLIAMAIIAFLIMRPLMTRDYNFLVDFWSKP